MGGLRGTVREGSGTLERGYHRAQRRSRESLRLPEPGHLEQCHIGIGFVLRLSGAEPQPLSRGYPLIRNGPKMATRGELSSSRLRYRPKTIPNAAPNGIPIPIQTGF